MQETQERCRLDPWVRKIPWKKALQPTPVLLPGKSHGQRSLAGCSPWGHKESDTTEQLCRHTHTHLPSTRFPRGLRVLMETSRQSKGRRTPRSSIQAPTKTLQRAHRLQGYVYRTPRNSIQAPTKTLQRAHRLQGYVCRTPRNSIQAPTKTLQRAHKLQGYVYRTPRNSIQAPTKTLQRAHRLQGCVYRTPRSSIQAPTKTLQRAHRLQGYVCSTPKHHSPLGRKQLNHFPARSPWMSPKELGTEPRSLDPLAEFQKANRALAFSCWDILLCLAFPCNICNPNAIARVSTWITGKKIGSEVKVPAPNAERIKLNLARFNKGCHKKSSLRFSLPNHQY